jgi:hypothetical protein
VGCGLLLSALLEGVVFFSFVIDVYSRKVASDANLVIHISDAG